MSERRDAYIHKLKAMLDEWNAEIDRLAAKEDKAGANAKIEYHKKLDELRAKREDIEARIEAMQKAGEDAWEDLKFDLESSWEFLREGLSIFKSEFQKGYRQGLKED
jgi:DNA mismatch repair ATPase MutS